MTDEAKARRAEIGTLRGGTGWEALKEELIARRNRTDKELHKAVQNSTTEPISLLVEIKAYQVRIDAITELIELVESGR